jgi:hypothetical protein
LSPNRTVRRGPGGRLDLDFFGGGGGGYCICAPFCGGRWGMCGGVVRRGDAHPEGRRGGHGVPGAHLEVARGNENSQSMGQYEATILHAVALWNTYPGWHLTLNEVCMEQAAQIVWALALRGYGLSMYHDRFEERPPYRPEIPVTEACPEGPNGRTGPYGNATFAIGGYPMRRRGSGRCRGGRWRSWRGISTSRSARRSRGCRGSSGTREFRYWYEGTGDGYPHDEAWVPDVWRRTWQKFGTTRCDGFNSGHCKMIDFVWAMWPWFRRHLRYACVWPGGVGVQSDHGFCSGVFRTP